MPSVQEPDLASAGVALLVIFGLLIWYDKPVESVRPFDSYAQHQDLQATGYAYESWLWQDPFAFDLDSYIERNQYYIEFGDDPGKTPPYLLRIYKKTDVEPVADKKESEDKRKETESKKAEPEEGQCEYELNEKIGDIKKKDKTKTVKILAPLLKVRPNTTENKELRTRHRYAVIAGLIESGYRPLEPDHLHFCFTQENKEYDVRWEHFHYESKPQSEADTSGKKPDIIVVWMNSEIITNPDKFDFMSKSLLSLEGIENFDIYDLNNILSQKRIVDVNEQIACINENNNKNIEFRRTETDDKGLADKLTEELKLRNIKEPSEVMIITEQDSENARRLAHNFHDSLCKPINANAENGACGIKNVFYLKGLDAYQQVLHKQDKNEEANKPAAHLSAIDLDIPLPLPIGPSQFDYFHRLAKQINDVHKEINLEKRDSGIRAIGIFGSDFYDKLLILEALRAEMLNIMVFTTGLDAQMLHPPHWTATRNLVVASDFNLLPEEKGKDNKGQHQKQSYQEQFPVFRDSQQTNIFYRTIEIVTNDVTRFEIPSPQVFEVGRHGLVYLDTVQENKDLDYLPSGKTLEQTRTRLLLLSAIIILFIWFHWEFRPNSRRLSIRLWLSTLAILAIAWFVATTDKLGEPLSFTDGVSLWPTIFIQLIAIILAVEFLYKARRELDENFCYLSRLYFPICLNRKDFPICLNECRRELSKLSSRSFLPFIILILTIVIYALNDVYPAESGLPFDYCLASLVFLLLFYLAFFYLLKVERWVGFISVKHWIEKDNCLERKTNQEKNFVRLYRALCTRLRAFFHSNNRSSSRSGLCQENYENGLWQEYYNYGLPDHRLSRVVTIWLFFSIIETILIYLLPPWPLPCRGPTCDLVSWIGVLSFSVIMILLFFILDTVRLNFYWIKKLRTQHPLIREKITNEHRYAFRFAATNYPLQSLEKIVAVVAERTSVVDKLIYYPMLCIMLMLFARIAYFDNQDFPLSKGVTFAVSISLLFFSGFMLRTEAEKLKRSVIECAENLGRNNRHIQSEARKVIKRIKDISEGAFEPMFEQPVLRALLIILASIGLFASEYLKLFE